MTVHERLDAFDALLLPLKLRFETAKHAQDFVDLPAQVLVLEAGHVNGMPRSLLSPLHVAALSRPAFDHAIVEAESMPARLKRNRYCTFSTNIP